MRLGIIAWTAVAVMAAGCGEDATPGGTGTVTDAADAGGQDMLGPETEVAGTGAILVSPTAVDFGFPAPGGAAARDLLVRNVGDGTLYLTGLQLTGSSQYEVFAAGQWYASNAQTASGVAFAEAVALEPGEDTTWTVRFTNTSPDGEGELVVESTDAASPATVVTLSANAGAPCLSMSPKEIDFGPRLVGEPSTIEVELVSCGSEPVEITELTLLSDAELSDAFTLDLGGLPGIAAGTQSLGGAGPVVLGANESATFTVSYAPTAVSPIGADGKAIRDLQRLRLESDAYDGDRELDVSGFGVDEACPVAVIEVSEGDLVTPQTKLHLHSSQSFAMTGNIAKYEWSVEQPPGSQSVFLPSAAAPDPTFDVNVAGTYVFRLEVWDANNVESCEVVEFVVKVVPPEGIWVELTWHTPSDPDETDEGPEAGADLNLHFAHENGGEDPWFDSVWDCYWFAPEPDWGSFDPLADDDPGLHRDDTDGAGPENVGLASPEDGVSYQVGVYYWDAHGFGASEATVRVYVDGGLAFEVEDVELVEGDMWEVATIGWPSGDVTPQVGADGGQKIVADYPVPFQSP